MADEDTSKEGGRARGSEARACLARRSPRCRNSAIRRPNLESNSLRLENLTPFRMRP